MVLWVALLVLKATMLFGEKIIMYLIAASSFTCAVNVPASQISCTDIVVLPFQSIYSNLAAAIVFHFIAFPAVIESLL